MRAHPGSQCTKCGVDVYGGQELCDGCEAAVLRVALAEAQRERDEAREQLAKAYRVIAWMKALPGVSHLMAVSLLRGGR